MELRSLRYFAAVARYGSFSRASERLNVSQPAISRQIQLLERELRMQLFDRVGRRTVLTSAGEEMVQRCYTILKDVEGLEARASELASGKRGLFRIGATPQTLESLVAKVLPAFQRKHPDVEIVLVEEGSARLVHLVEQGFVHLAIGAPSYTSEFQERPLFPLGVLAVVPRNHRLAHRKSLDVTALADEPILLLREEFMTRQLFDGACQVAQIRPRVRIESGSPHCLIALVSGALGIAIIPSTVRIDGMPHAAIPLHQGGRQLGLWMHAIWNPRRYVPPAVESFIDELYIYTQRDYPGKEFQFGQTVQIARTVAGKGIDTRTSSARGWREAEPSSQ